MTTQSIRRVAAFHTFVLFTLLSMASTLAPGQTLEVWNDQGAPVFVPSQNFPLNLDLDLHTGPGPDPFPGPDIRFTNFDVFDQGNGGALGYEFHVQGRVTNLRTGANSRIRMVATGNGANLPRGTWGGYYAGAYEDGLPALPGDGRLDILLHTSSSWVLDKPLGERPCFIDNYTLTPPPPGAAPPVAFGPLRGTNFCERVMLGPQTEINIDLGPLDTLNITATRIVDRPIPTLSEWGMIALITLLLAGGTAMLWKRPRAGNV